MEQGEGMGGSAGYAGGGAADQGGSESSFDGETSIESFESGSASDAQSPGDSKESFGDAGTNNVQDSEGISFEEGQEIQLDQPSNLVDFEEFKSSKEAEVMDPGEGLRIAKESGFEDALSYFAHFDEGRNETGQTNQDAVEGQHAEGDADLGESREDVSRDTQSQDFADANALDDISDTADTHAVEDDSLGETGSDTGPDGEAQEETVDQGSEEDTQNTGDIEEAQDTEAEPLAEQDPDENVEVEDTLEPERLDDKALLEKPEVKALLEELKGSNELMKKMLERMEKQDKLNAEILLILAMLLKKQLEEKKKKDEKEASLISTLFSLIGFLVSMMIDPEKESGKVEQKAEKMAA